MLQRQQVGLLLLQALMESLGLALLLELPPLELLLQSVGLIQGGEKRRPAVQQSDKLRLRLNLKLVASFKSIIFLYLHTELQHYLTCLCTLKLTSVI